MPCHRPLALVADDDPPTRALAVNFLIEIGFEPIEAGDGRQALSILSGEPDICVLLTDVCMPYMNGIELAAAARRMRPHLRIVLTSGLTAWTGTGDAVFLPKPWRLRDLEAALRSA
jgi:two-component system capsular synthesis sensor histidine kinase RcsC